MSEFTFGKLARTDIVCASVEEQGLFLLGVRVNLTVPGGEARECAYFSTSYVQQATCEDVRAALLAGRYFLRKNGSILVIRTARGREHAMFGEPLRIDPKERTLDKWEIEQRAREQLQAASAARGKRNQRRYDLLQDYVNEGDVPMPARDVLKPTEHPRETEQQAKWREFNENLAYGTRPRVTLEERDRPVAEWAQEILDNDEPLPSRRETRGLNPLTAARRKAEQVANGGIRLTVLPTGKSTSTSKTNKAGK